MDRFQQLPKVNLHHHLEGAVRPATFLEYVQQLHLPLAIKDLAEAHAYLQVSPGDQTLADFLIKVDRTLAITQYPGVLERLAFEAVEDAYLQNVRYLEIRFGPWLHVGQRRSVEMVIEEVLAGMQRAMAEYPIIARLIVCALRQHDPQQNLTLATVAPRYLSDGLVGFDIAGDEAAYPAGVFVEAFMRAKTGGLGITVHAGEVGDGRSVMEAITVLGADRIGHGIQISTQPDLVEAVKASGVTLEICPTSNVHTRAVARLEHHPIRQLFDQGIRVSLGDDDPTTSGITLSSEYALLADIFHFTDTEITKVVLTGAQAAFLSKSEKNALISQLQLELDRWLAQHSQ